MSGAGEGFLARWSRRKAGASAEEVAPTAAPPAAAPSSASAIAVPAAAIAPAEREAPPTPAGEPAATPLPTLADVAALTRDSDYSRFMLPGVDGPVRNAALRKLFSDPRFNVMDGLDTYIDDYGKPDPLPVAMLRRMNQATALGLFSDDAPGEAAAIAHAHEGIACPDGTPVAEVAPSPCPPLPPDARARAEDDPDLRLQPDDVDRRPGTGPGPGT
ncbi:MAG TPA: DUF3306 domain-containing protein [Caldimonas sp.]|nr:DUF3306 domain-containing protein [Caldimonas sp.]HEX4234472.1 DUF3306 domain-containing protein [Caldimonas sp.]